MNRTRSLWMLAVLLGISCVWWTGLRADDVAVIAPPSDQTVELLARIEKLELRVQTLEKRTQAIHQVAVAPVVADEWVSPAPLGTPVPSPSQPQFGIVYQLKRFIPDPPTEKDSGRARQEFNSIFGGMGIHR